MTWISPVGRAACAACSWRQTGYPGRSKENSGSAGDGQAHWIDLDLPDAIELRRKFFADTDRRRMAAASVLDTEWLQVDAQSPGPYFFVTDGVLVYLTEEQVSAFLTRIKIHFPNALIALDTYPQRTVDQQHKLAARRDIPATFAWACDDPRTLERLGLQVLETTGVARLPAAARRQLPASGAQTPVLRRAGRSCRARAPAPAAGRRPAPQPAGRSR
jgi:O-methyltransferase involved in polyketide biosynthesis